MNIRQYSSRDASALAKIFHEAVHKIGSLDYSQKQLAAWSPRPVVGANFAKRVSDGRDVLVATDANDYPIGFIELESDGHIDCFYCDPEYAGNGVGAALYLALEAKAIERGITLLFVEASEAARRFFYKFGFTCEERRDFLRNGVKIHNHSMRKPLNC